MRSVVSTNVARFLEQDYAWIRRGMLFPFLEHVDRFVTVIYVSVVLVFCIVRVCETLLRLGFRDRLT